jgi:hypothetical protein
MFNRKSIVWAIAGIIGVSAAGLTFAEGPGARAAREREEARAAEQRKEEEKRAELQKKWAKEDAAKERAEDKQDHPEMWNAIRQLRAARNNLLESRNEKTKFKEPAIKAINDAIATLEGIMARD